MGIFVRLIFYALSKAFILKEHNDKLFLLIIEVSFEVT